MAKLYNHTNGEYIVELEEGASMGFVQLYWHLIDLWMPLLGTECIGVYSMLVRLGGKRGRTDGNTLKFLARACRIGDKKLREYCDILKEFGFIKMHTPTKEQRGSGYKTQFYILQPPERVTPLHIEFAKQKGYVPKDFVYQPFTHWLVKNLNNRENRPDWDPTEFDLSLTDDMPSSTDDNS